MKRSSSAENKAESITVLTHSYTKWNIPEGLCSPLLLFTEIFAFRQERNKSNCGYQVHGSERKMSHFLYIDDLNC
jgi:hypothetical protein